VIAQHHSIVALIIIISVVVLLARLALDLLGPCSYKINCLEIQNLSFFKVGQVASPSVLLEALANSHGESSWRRLDLASKWRLGGAFLVRFRRDGHILVILIRFLPKYVIALLDI
jgi:hypothetical protein